MQRSNVRVTGRIDGPPLLLVQGFGCDQVIWDDMLPAFTSRYKVVLFDHVGTGDADPGAYDPVKYATLDGYLSDVLDVMEALDLQDAVVVGHSIAGAMALAAAVDSPRVKQLVLLGTSACYLNDDGYAGGFEPQDIEKILATVETNYPLWAMSAATRVTGMPAGSAASEKLADRLCRMQPGYVRAFLQMSFHTDIRHLLPQVRIPVLVLQPAADPLTPAAASQYLCDNLSASTFKALDSCGNMPHATAPGETARAILEYLEAPRG